AERRACRGVSRKPAGLTRRDATVRRASTSGAGVPLPHPDPPRPLMARNPVLPTFIGVSAPAPARTSARKCPRLCENTQEPRKRKSFFSIAVFPIGAKGVFFFRLTKSRKIFYAQIYCLCFHTAWPRTCRSEHQSASIHWADSGRA